MPIAKLKNIESQLKSEHGITNLREPNIGKSFKVIKLTKKEIKKLSDVLKINQDLKRIFEK